MTKHEATDTLGLVHRHWPKTEAWAPEQKVEFIRLVERIAIDFEQARAALLALSMRSKYASIKPVEALDALRAAVNQITEERAQTTPPLLKRAVALATDVLLHRLPSHLRHEALLRIDRVLPREDDRTNLGRNLAAAARQAEAGDWPAALEWPLFRFEVKECPAVRAWLSQQELPALDIATFANVSCNPY